MGKYLNIVLASKGSDTQDSRVQDEKNEFTKKGYGDKISTRGGPVDRIDETVDPQARFKSLFNCLVSHLQGRIYTLDNFTKLQELSFVMVEAWEAMNYDNLKAAIEKMLAVPDGRPLWQRPDGSCYACGSREAWRSIYKLTCARCHPPATPDMVMGWIRGTA